MIRHRPLVALLTLLLAAACRRTEPPAETAKAAPPPPAEAPAVPSETGGTVTVVDAKRLKPVKTIKLGEGMRPMGTAVAPDDKSLYVTTGRSKMLLVIDTGTNAVVGSVEAGARPWGLALAADGKTAYTANGPSNDVAVIDLETRRVTRTIPVGQGPWGAAFVQRRSTPATR